MRCMAAMFVKVSTELCRCHDHTLPPIPSMATKCDIENLKIIQKNISAFKYWLRAGYVSPKLAKQEL
jgi:hypothetical protein